MQEGFSLFPEAASTVADSVDQLYLFEIAVSIFFSLLIAGLLLFFSIRYRSSSSSGRTPAHHIHGSLRLEVLWTVIPLLLTMVMFFWGAAVYFDMRTPPREGMQFHVTGKQWMWRVQHPTGHREINAMHVPVGRPILMTMISEDVIHDFFVPAFRVKYDVLPGRYTQAWFEATKTGTYHLFCAEYCGTQHSGMVGKVVVMEPAEYERWLSGQPEGQDPVEAGAALFQKHRCHTCHAAGSGQRGPDLQGLFGTERPLEGGGTVTADAEYVRESILKPKAKVVAGFQPVMPTYQGQITEEEILHLIAYIKSLEVENATTDEPR